MRQRGLGKAGFVCLLSVLLLGAGSAVAFGMEQAPGMRSRSAFSYYPGTIRIPESSAPDFKNKSWAITAEVMVADKPPSGVLATIGGRFGGWVLLMQDGRPEFAYALSSRRQQKFRIAAREAISPGNHVIRLLFGYDGGGTGKGATGRLFVDGRQVAEGRIPQTIPTRFSRDETFDVGEDTGSPVIEDYADRMPFAFSGTLQRFLVVLEPDRLTAEERGALLQHEPPGRWRRSGRRAAVRRWRVVRRPFRWAGGGPPAGRLGRAGARRG